MKLKLKKFLFLLNDLTSLFLAKEVKKELLQIKRLQNRLIIVSLALVISIIINIVLLYKAF